MSRKFRNHQKVVIKDMLVNGERRDTWGLVTRYIKGKVEVQVNSVFLQFPEERLEDYEEHWRKKRGDEDDK